MLVLADFHVTTIIIYSASFALNSVVVLIKSYNLCLGLKLSFWIFQCYNGRLELMT